MNGAGAAAQVLRCNVIVCHPELLLAEALAAALSVGGVADAPVIVTSPDQLLAHAGSSSDLALVSDSIGSELPELLEALTHRQSDLPVLILTDSSDFHVAARALEWGAVGSVSAAAPFEVLLQAVVDACAGRVVLLDGATEQLTVALNERSAERAVAETLFRSLTDRERVLVNELASGRSTAEIAAHLMLSPHTVRASIRALGTKLGARGQLGIAGAARDLLQAIRPPSRRFMRWRRTALDGW